jgi:hypothetical protein
MAQSRVLRVPRVQLIRRLARTIEQPTSPPTVGRQCHRSHARRVAYSGGKLIPIDLGLLSPTAALRHERLAPQQSHLTFALVDVVAHRRLSDRGVREFRQDPTMNAPRRVALLARCTAVLGKRLVDEVGNRAQLRLVPFRVMVRRWQRTRNRSANNPPMNAKLRGTPAIVPTPNSCSRRSCSNKSTLALQSTKGPLIHQGDRRLRDGGWAKIGQHSWARIR